MLPGLFLRPSGRRRPRPGRASRLGVRPRRPLARPRRPGLRPPGRDYGRRWHRARQSRSRRRACREGQQGRSRRRHRGRGETFGNVRGHPAQLGQHRVEPGPHFCGLSLRGLANRGCLAARLPGRGIGFAGRLPSDRGRLAFRRPAYRGGIILCLVRDLGRLVIGQRENLPGAPERIASRFLPAGANVPLGVAGVAVRQTLLTLEATARPVRTCQVGRRVHGGPAIPGPGGWKRGHLVVSGSAVRDGVKPSAAAVVTGIWSHRRAAAPPAEAVSPPLRQDIRAWCANCHGPRRMVFRQLDPRHRRRRMIRMHRWRRSPVPPVVPLLPDVIVRCGRPARLERSATGIIAAESVAVAVAAAPGPAVVVVAVGTRLWVAGLAVADCLRPDVSSLDRRTT